VADLARLHQLLERAGGLLERCRAVGPVDLVEVDVVGAEMVEARVDSLAEPLGARVADDAVALRPQAALRGEHDLVAPGAQLLAERLRHELLGSPEAVGLGGVEEADPEFESATDGRHVLPLVQRPPVAAELPRAEADARHLEAAAAEDGSLHACSSVGRVDGRTAEGPLRGHVPTRREARTFRRRAWSIVATPRDTSLSTGLTRPHVHV